MSSPYLNLLVIRSADMEKTAAFYAALGLSFSKHTHGTGPEHYPAEAAGFTFEIYPELGSSTIATRIGFKVVDLDGVLSRLL